jgi:hypothetical protein
MVPDAPLFNRNRARRAWQGILPVECGEKAF